MHYIFIFLGEFGYELFNWQGRIRRFKQTVGINDKIICCSRANLHPLYEVADSFIDISELALFKQSIASCYQANHSSFYLDESDYDEEKNIYREKYNVKNNAVNYVFQQEVKAAIHSYISSILNIPPHAHQQLTFIFSSDSNRINGITFGGGNIYGEDDLSQNLYAKINIEDEQLYNALSSKVPFPLASGYILVQQRKRNIVIRSKDSIAIEKYIEKASKHSNIICLDFNTGRSGDSYSFFDDIENVCRVQCTSFPEQAVLVKHASACIFFTEGDFGSHIYVPPFMGKDVYAVAPRNIYNIGTTPIEFWNNQIFTFGGKIKQYTSEDIFESPEALELFDAMIAKKVSYKNYLQSIEDEGKKVNFEDFYLWPRTVRAKDHQDKIRERVGADDYSLNNPRSRTYTIVKHLKKLIAEKKIPNNFSLADICCGDAVVLAMVQREFPEATCYGQDCLKDEFETHDLAYKFGVELYGGYIQHIVEKNLQTPFDVVLMLNTYRGWHSADLREHEKELPLLVDAWLKQNSRFTIVTARHEQIVEKKQAGIDVKIIGVGEDESHMICFNFLPSQES